MNATIRIPHGNDFCLNFPLVLLTPNGEEDIAAAELTDISVKVGRGSNLVSYAYTIEDNLIVVEFDETLTRGTYDVHIYAKLAGRDIASHLKECFAIVDWNKEGNFKDYVFEKSQTVSTSVFIGNNAVDTELAALKASYQQKIAEAEAARQASEQAREEAEQTAYTNTAILSSQQEVISSQQKTIAGLQHYIDDVDDDVAARIRAIIGVQEDTDTND